MTRFTLMLLVAAIPSLAIAAPVAEHPKHDGVRTGGMGIGTRPTGEATRPGTDMTTAGSGAGKGKPGTKAGAVGSTGEGAAKPR
ncbi:MULTISPECIES: hypothetical protein [unclassified Methylobacterium]|uniref:hypothetical protein n=1 Tax=unclassified Methylobacterium TaxID=2615210 RepID=UPI0011C1E02A|nr:MULTISPECIES: hypothetical protein [unclassified Methylobacterium]QEE39176.1 hypothetical protein FVA80_09700 [Methylobacterium sp. WL1]TXN56034.1 hypothetical protein FV241_17205 [Methylobacterium sp. WL2]